MKKEERCLRLASKAAETSNYGNFRHGAVLVKGGSIFNITTNSFNHTSFGQRFRSSPGHATHHAEVACVLGLDKATTYGATIYVARVNKNGEWRMSKPCEMCEEVMKHVGIKKVVYTVDTGRWVTYNLRNGIEIEEGINNE
jgi:tRNA(Arg) A34 adenosine deaminase TadA